MLKPTILSCFLLLTTVSSAAPLECIKLLPPQKTGGKSIMECLFQRESTKSFAADKPLTLQQLSNIFFAAGGINRANGKLTIPTARNLQNQSVYACLPNGIYCYNAPTHTLEIIRAGYFMDKIGRQNYHKDAGVILIYVSDLPVIGNDVKVQESCSGTHAGLAAQNVYLYCASENLGTVICGNFDGGKLHKLLKLRPGQKVYYLQPAGHKK